MILIESITYREVHCWRVCFRSPTRPYPRMFAVHGYYCLRSILWKSSIQIPIVEQLLLLEYCVDVCVDGHENWKGIIDSDVGGQKSLFSHGRI